MNTIIRKATKRDAAELSIDLRQEDLDEIQSSHGVDPLEGLLACLKVKNAENYAVVSNDVCIAMFGVCDCPFVPDFGVVWLLSSDKLRTERKRFIRESREWVQKLNTKYTTIYNWVHPNNWHTLKWLQYCGFEAKLKHKYGVKNEDFILIMRTK